MMAQKKSILLKVNGQLRDLNTPLNPGDQVEEIDPSVPEALEVYRHSCSHLLAQAVCRLFPGTQYGIGPAVENGFYYDFLSARPFTPEDLEQVGKVMKEIVKADLPVEHLEWSRDQAIEYFRGQGQSLKVELIEEKTSGESISLYRQGEFVDLCRGPHLPSTGHLRHFALTTVAAAYWKGDENSHSLQRIYGAVFPSAGELEEYLKFLKEAQARDHRKLGRELDLFSQSDEIGAGLVLWHPRGAMIRHEIEKFWKDEHLKNGYELLYTPHLADLNLWRTSGHLDYYRENMFPPMEFEHSAFQLKPMNCPFHIAVYKSKTRSYRDLPLRWAELGTVYRYERSGVLHGLLRVRGFTQDDAHIFCTPEQLEDEVVELLAFSTRLLASFGFNELNVNLSTRPERFVGEIEDWDKATEALARALRQSGVEYRVDHGEGVFYGPKIDIKIKDVLQRWWQLTTIQVDFNLPRRFDLRYSDPEGGQSHPFMVHRALLGSLERFFGILVEHYGGAFPLWLAPVQAIVLPVSEHHLEYARRVQDILSRAGIRAEVETRNEGVGKKIRNAETRKIPYLLVVGDREKEAGNVALRIHKLGDRGSIELAELIGSINRNREEKKLDYEI